MTFITRLNSFNEVAARYAEIKPVVSKNHPAVEDVRPIGKRSRKWERIIRVAPNTYVLSCGGHADPVFNWGNHEKLKEFPLTAKDIARLSPIVWRKHKDGTETITVRNGWGEWQHNSWYSFLQRALPRELWFRINRQGRQAIYNRAEGKEYYLPKTKTVPKHVYEYHRENAQKSNGWAKKYFKACKLDFDNLSLTFKRLESGKFELLGEAPKEMVKRTRVNMGDKAKHKKDINEVYAWATTMYPMMRTQLNWTYRNEVEQNLREKAKDKAIKGFTPGWNRLFHQSEPSLIRAILSDPEHPMRYEFGVAAMFVINDEVECRTHEDLSDEELQSKIRAAYTRWINKIGGFVKTTKEEK
jgi:hypothetical protein